MIGDQRLGRESRTAYFSKFLAAMPQNSKAPEDGEEE